MGGIASCCEGNSGSNIDATDKEFVEEGNVNEHTGDDGERLPAETSGGGEPIQPEESESSGVGEGRLGGTIPRKNGGERYSRKSKKDRQGTGRRKNFRQQAVELEIPSEEDGEYKTHEEGDVGTERKVNHPLSLPRVKFLERG